MIAGSRAAGDREWWIPHAMSAAFVLMVAAILRLMFGWTAPFHVWVALSDVALAALVASTGWRAARLVARRHWRGAGLSLSVAVLLALTGVALAIAGHAHPAGLLTLDEPVDGRAR